MHLPDGLTARDLMTPRPDTVADTATVGEAAAFLADRGFGAAVVIGPHGRPLGVVTKTDLLVHAREGKLSDRPDPATVRQVMSEMVISVPEHAPVRTVVERMVAMNVRHLFVVDAAGTVVGVISPLDVLRRLL